MYHIALTVKPDDEHLGDKVDAVTALPHAAESVRVTVVHVFDGDQDVESVPAVSDIRARLTAVDIETAVRGVVGADPPGGLLEAAANLGVDAICIGGRRRSPAGKLQLKPGAEKTILRAEVPVIVAGDLESREPRV